jgi:hypothetical protein
MGPWAPLKRPPKPIKAPKNLQKIQALDEFEGLTGFSGEKMKPVGNGYEKN